MVESQPIQGQGPQPPEVPPKLSEYATGGVSFLRAVNKVGGTKKRTQKRVFIVGPAGLVMCDVSSKKSVKRFLRYSELVSIKAAGGGGQPQLLIQPKRPEHDLLLLFNEAQLNGRTQSWQDVVDAVDAIQAQRSAKCPGHPPLSVECDQQTQSLYPVADTMRSPDAPTPAKKLQQTVQEARQQRSLQEQQGRLQQEPPSPLPALPPPAWPSEHADNTTHLSVPRPLSHSPPPKGVVRYTVQLSSPTDILGLDYNEHHTGAVVIENVFPNSCSGRAGVPPGRLLAFNGQTIVRPGDLEEMLQKARAEGRLLMTLDVVPTDKPKEDPEATKRREKEEQIIEHERALRMWEEDIELREKGMQHLEAFPSASSASLVHQASCTSSVASSVVSASSAPPIPELLHTLPSFPYSAPFLTARSSSSAPHRDAAFLAASPTPPDAPFVPPHHTARTKGPPVVPGVDNDDFDVHVHVFV